MKRKLAIIGSLAAVGCICLLGQPFISTNYTQVVFPPRTTSLEEKMSELEVCVKANSEMSFKLGAAVAWRMMITDPSYATNGLGLVEDCWKWRTNVLRAL